MERWRGQEDIPSDWGRCVLTIGVFDGVHRGHAELIERAVKSGRARGVPTVLMTFDPHPMEVVFPGSHPAQLTTLTRRAELVEELGIDVFLVMPFSPDFMKLTPERYVHELLVERLHVLDVVVGENFTFGKKAAGNVDTLRRAGERLGFAVESVSLVAEQHSSQTVTFSSTYIRSCVDAGDVVAAEEALGRPHRVEGVVVRGDGRGRGLGYPTANVAPPTYSAIPADGVYAAWFTVHRHDTDTDTGPVRLCPDSVIRPRFRWAPTRRSPVAPARLRLSSSTSPPTCTDNMSRWTSWPACAGRRSSPRWTISSRRWAVTPIRPGRF